MVKICKLIPITSQDSLGTKEFVYDVYVPRSVGLLVTATLGRSCPGECTFFSRGAPDPQAERQYSAIGVDENAGDREQRRTR